MRTELPRRHEVHAPKLSFRDIFGPVFRLQAILVNDSRSRRDRVFPKEGATMTFKEYVSVRTLSELTDISVSTWNKRRLTGNTPPYMKVGRSVRYHIPTVKEWMNAHQRRSTSEADVAEEATQRDGAFCGRERSAFRHSHSG